MIRFFILRFLLPLALFLLVRALLKSLWGSFNTSVPAERPGADPNLRTGGELKKDPVCGTYVSPATAITQTFKGEVLHFCSAACRDKYRRAS